MIGRNCPCDDDVAGVVEGGRDDSKVDNLSIKGQRKYFSDSFLPPYSTHRARVSLHEAGMMANATVTWMQSNVQYQIIEQFLPYF